MIKVECTTCGRWHEKEGSKEGGKPSEGPCARCACIINRDGLYTDTDGDVDERALIDDMIRYELEAGIVWSGEDRSSFSAEDREWYEGLLRQAEGKLREVSEATEGHGKLKK